MQNDGLAVAADEDREEAVEVLARNGLAAGELISFKTAQALERQMLSRTKTAASGAPACEPACEPASPETTGAALDGRLLDRHGIVLWRTPQALIVPSGMPKIEGFAAAARASDNSGWPVYERDTGGDLTPQFDGILNLSMTFCVGEGERNIAAAYGRLIAPVLAFLREDMGIEGYASSVRGAFCDGAHNIVVDGRKLAGTAQRWRLMPERAGEANVTRVLGHIAIVCGGNLGGALDAVNAFYSSCGIDRRVVREAHITLQEAAGGKPAPAEAIARRLADFIDARMSGRKPD